MIIKRLDVKDLITAEKVVDVQKVSYKVEADMIGFQKIPPMLESVEKLMECTDVFHGCFIDDRLAGIAAYRFDDDHMRISRVAVHPDFFRKGVASGLIDHILLEREGYDRVVVGTGQKNVPAVTLYEKKGFTKIEDIEIAPGVGYRKFEKWYR